MYTGISEPAPAPTEDHIATLEAMSGDGIEVSFIDADGQPRRPSHIEEHVTRIFDEVDGRRQPEVNEDGSFTERLYYVAEGETADLIMRTRRKDGAVVGVRLSGLAFMGQVTNDHLEIDRNGNVAYRSYDDQEVEPLRLRERIKLLKTLRSIH